MTARGIVDNGIVLISHGAIEEVGTKIPVPKSTPVIETNGVIFPGLIDWHNHLVWNVFPWCKVVKAKHDGLTRGP